MWDEKASASETGGAQAFIKEWPCLAVQSVYFLPFSTTLTLLAFFAAPKPDTLPSARSTKGKAASLTHSEDMACVTFCVQLCPRYALLLTYLIVLQIITITIIAVAFCKNIYPVPCLGRIEALEHPWKPHCLGCDTFFAVLSYIQGVFPLLLLTCYFQWSLWLPEE